MLKRRRRSGLYVTAALGLMLISNFFRYAQQAAGTPLTIGQAVESALKNYPAVSVSQEQVNAAAAGIGLARTAYLPRVDSLAQVNRATRNNVFGLLFPQGAYLKITAPFDGVVTERIVHSGTLVGPGSNDPLLVLQQISHLRVTVAVPEENVGAMAKGAKVAFQVPAYPDRSFSGMIARPAQSLDSKTRTMAVELDVVNPDSALAPGMYATVKWPVHRAQSALFVPRTSVVTTTERTFVIRDKNGKARMGQCRQRRG